MRSPRDAMAALQAAGVPAAAMLRVGELPQFPHFVVRQFFRRVSHPKIPEPFYVETAPVRSENLPDPPDGPRAAGGRTYDGDCKVAFDLSDAEIDRLIRAKVLEVADADAGVGRA